MRPRHLAPPQTSRTDMESAPTGMRARSFTHLHTKKACPKRQALRLFYSCAFSSLSRTKRHSSPMVKSSLSSLSSISSPIALAQCPRQLDHILMVGAQVSQRCAAAQIAPVSQLNCSASRSCNSSKVIPFSPSHWEVLCSYHTSPQRFRQGANPQQPHKFIAPDLWNLPKAPPVTAAVRSKCA